MVELLDASIRGILREDLLSGEAQNVCHIPRWRA